MTLTMDPPVKAAVAFGNTQPGGMRITDTFVQYDVSPTNPKALANLGQALAGNLHRPELTFYDPEEGRERQLGDVLVSVDLSDPNAIVLQHMDTAGKGAIGRFMESTVYQMKHPLKIILMKGLGVVADPEKIYQQKIIQTLATLEQEGLFGPPGASTFSLSDWTVDTRTNWRDVVIKRKEPEKEPVKDILADATFSDTLSAAARIPFV